MFFVGIVSFVGVMLGFVSFCDRASPCHSGWPGTQDPLTPQPPECGDYRHVPPHLLWYSLLTVHFWLPLYLHILAWKAFEVTCLVLHAIFHVLYLSLKSGRLNITNGFFDDLGSLHVDWLEAQPWAGDSQGHILTSSPPTPGSTLLPLPNYVLFNE